MSKMNLTQAADEVRKLLRGLKAVELVSDAMEEAGSIENAAKEAEKQLGNTRAAIENAKAEYDKLEADIKAAKDEAKKVRDTAKAKADELLNKASESVAEMAVAAAAGVDRTKEELAGLMLSMQEARQQKEAAQKELEAVEAKIEKAKAYLNKMIATI